MPIIVQGFKDGLRTNKVSGANVVTIEDLNNISSSDFMFAHMLGVMTRAERRTMYYLMLQHGLRHANDKLAHHGLSMFLHYVQRKKETSTDVGDMFLEPMWKKEKQLRLRETQYRVLRICQLVCHRQALYIDVTPTHWRDYEGKLYDIRMTKTWQFAVLSIMSTLYEYSQFPPREYWGLPWDAKLVERAFAAVSVLGTENEFKKTLRETAGVKLRAEPRAYVLEQLKNKVNSMSLEQVVYFLKAFPRMPKDMLPIFRIEYVRKGGELALPS